LGGVNFRTCPSALSRYNGEMSPHPLIQDIPFQKPLIRWFQRYQERLPWRATQDPYKIWVSEIMLQQTTVNTVIPYYKRFIHEFPDCHRLAAASLEDVLKIWSGLGYYSRARNLHQGARYVVGHLQGRLPNDPEVLQKIPGIGRYSAGAIASIAFQKPVPLVDGNVIRVYSRLFWIDKDIKKHQKYYWDVAEQVMPQDFPGDFNQGLMELGRRVCTPTKPTCLLCPLRPYCRAVARGNPEALPKKIFRNPSHPVTMGVALICDQGRFLMVQRQGKTVLKDMWEFPMLATTKEKLSPKTITNNIVHEWQLKTEVIKMLPALKHSIMNQRITLLPFVLHLCEKTRKRKEWQWIKPDQIHHIATSSMNKKVLGALSQSFSTGGQDGHYF